MNEREYAANSLTAFPTDPDVLADLVEYGTGLKRASGQRQHTQRQLVPRLKSAIAEGRVSPVFGDQMLDRLEHDILQAVREEMSIDEFVDDIRDELRRRKASASRLDRGERPR